MTKGINVRNCMTQVNTLMTWCDKELLEADSLVQQWMDALSERDQATAELAETIDLTAVNVLEDIDIEAITNIRDTADKLLVLRTGFDELCNHTQTEHDNHRSDASAELFENAEPAAIQIAEAVERINTFTVSSSLAESIGRVLRVKLDPDTNRTPVIELHQQHLGQWIAYSSPTTRAELITKFRELSDHCTDFRNKCTGFRRERRQVQHNREAARRFIHGCAGVQDDLPQLLAALNDAIESYRNPT